MSQSSCFGAGGDGNQKLRGSLNAFISEAVSLCEAVPHACTVMQDNVDTLSVVRHRFDAVTIVIVQTFMQVFFMPAVASKLRCTSFDVQGTTHCMIH